MKVRTKTVKAPDWFVQGWEEVADLQNQLEVTLGMPVRTFKAFDKEQIKKMLSPQQMNKGALISSASNSLKESLFHKLRLEKFDTDPDLANADVLTYVEETKKIKVEMDVVGRIKESLLKVVNKMASL